MIILIPTGTDAPCYHPPYATFGLIVVNVFVLVLQYLLAPEITENFILSFETINPIQWLTSSIMHGGLIHLIGNMLVFAICGWIIEGKIGWWRLIVLYFTIAAIEGAIVQTSMWLAGGTSGALGASGVIFGMLAIILLWAPENEISYFGIVFILYIWTFSFSASVLVVCYVMIGLEFLTAAFTQFQMSSAMLHLLGALPGGLIGYLMIRWRWVDCEGYDLISIMSGNRGKRTLTVQDEAKLKQERLERKVEGKQDLLKSSEMIDFYLSKGKHEVALSRYQMQRRKDKRFELTEKQMLAIITGIWKTPDKRKTVSKLMEQYLKQHKTNRVWVALSLAHYCLSKEERPRKCLRLVQEVSNDSMSEKETLFAKQLVLKSKELIANGVIDFVDE